jgi:phytoene dehydrogenase-like protein
MSKYDTIIIGGGHNGLTAATILAKKGQKVSVLEKRSTLGGIAAGEEFQPGYTSSGLLHDTGAVRNQIIKELSLKKFGLEVTGKRASFAVLGKKEECVVITDDINETSKNIAKYSEKDGNAYFEYRKFIEKISPLIQGLMNQIPPDLVKMGTGDLWELAKKGLGLKRLGKSIMMELLKVAPMSVQDFLDERFETEFLKTGLAVPAIQGSFTSPRSAYTTLNLLIWECLSQEEIIGGPAALTSALEKAAQKSGVTIRLDCNVEQVLLDDDRNVRGIKLKNGEEIESFKVAASCSPNETFFNLLEPNQIEYSLENGIEHFRARGTTAKLNLALNKPFQLKGTNEEVEYARTGNTWLEMEKAYDPIKYNEFSTEPILDIHVTKNSSADDYVASILIHYVPFDLKGGWTTKAKKDLMKNIINTLSLYYEDPEKCIQGFELLTPVELQEIYTLPNGHIFHGEHAIDQTLTRPIPSCMRYSTPINGLYLCGSGSHPGGGITCMPGYLGAKMMLKS